MKKWHWFGLIGIVIVIILVIMELLIPYLSPQVQFVRKVYEKNGYVLGDYGRGMNYISSSGTLCALSKVEYISLSKGDIAEFDFNGLKVIRDKYGLNLCHTNLTDSQLKTICQFKNIRSLDISGCKNITNEGIREIANLENLESLSICDTSCTDAEIRLVKDLPKLESLWLTRTQVDGSCFCTNDGWRTLQFLDLGRCKLKDEVFDFLPNFVFLRNLSFSLNEGDQLPPNFYNLMKNKELWGIFIYTRNLDEQAREDLQKEIEDKFNNPSSAIYVCEEER